MANWCCNLHLTCQKVQVHLSLSIGYMCKPGGGKRGELRCVLRGECKKFYLRCKPGGGERGESRCVLRGECKKFYLRCKPGGEERGESRCVLRGECKVFYLLLYSKALRTISLSPV